MNFTYDSSLSTDRDIVRFLIGDVDESDVLVGDEAIDYLLTEHSDTYAAAAAACERIAADSARFTSVSVDGVSVSSQEFYDRYMDLASRIRSQGASVGQPLPYHGGASRTERVQDSLDADLIPLHIRSHMHDHPESSGDRVNEKLSNQ